MPSSDRHPAPLGCFTWNRAGARGWRLNIWTPRHDISHVEPLAPCDGPVPAGPNAINRPSKGSEGHHAAVPPWPATSRDARNPPGFTWNREAPRSETCLRARRPWRAPDVWTSLTRQYGASVQRRSPFGLWVSASPWLRTGVGQADSWRPTRAVAHVPQTAPGPLGTRTQPRAARAGHLLHESAGEGRGQMLHVGPRRCVTAGTRWSGHLNSPEVFHIQPARCSTTGRQVRTPGPAGCPGCFTWNPQAMLGSLPLRFETQCLPGWADRGRPPRPTPAGSDTQTDQAAPGAASAFRCSVHRPRMRGCFTWNRRQCPGGRDARQNRAPGPVVARGNVRCSMALLLGHSDAQGHKIHVESRRSSALGSGQIRMRGRARCFTWNRRQCSGGTASLSIERPDRMSHTGVLYGAGVRRLGCPQPIRFHVELRRSTDGATDSDVWTGWMFHVEPGGQCLVARRLQIRTPGP